MIRIDVGLPRNLAKYNTPDLFEVYVHDYQDSYHRDVVTVDKDLERAARSISSRPRTLTEYYKSMDIYNEYMGALASIHGGVKLFKKKLKDGVIEEFVPVKPRPKNKGIRKLGKMGIHISERPKKGVDIASIVEWAKTVLMPERDDDVSVETEFEAKDVKKVYKAALKDTKGAMSARRGFGSEIDMMAEYFEMKRGLSSSKANKKKKKNKETKLRISDFMKGDYLKDLEDTTPDDPMTSYNGILLSSENVETLAVYRKLGELGWDSYSLMKRGKFSKRTLEHFKKYKKSKKDKKKKKKNSKYECVIDIGEGAFGSFMSDVASTNGYDDFEEFSLDMLDATWDNVRAQCQGQC